MLFGEVKYVKEFADAAIISFDEFKNNFAQYLKDRDEVNFRRMGHKIKPVAQMLGLIMILEEALIKQKGSDLAISNSLQRIHTIIDQVLLELHEVSVHGIPK
jgi:HPt (histidine-containing phosphotransfer) domain-containing protein